MKLSKAVKVLKKSLKEDSEYYYGWQANIAMSFYDEFMKLDRKLITKKNLHTVSNDAAMRFLNNLLND